MALPGQNWKGPDFDPKDSPSRRRVQDCIQRTNWHELCRYASKANHGIPCRPLPDMTNGLYNLVRLLEFEDKTCWVVRIQMARSTKELATRLQSEVDVMRLLRDRTHMPVPRVYEHKVDDKNSTGVAFILMEFLPGNVAVDADGGYEAHRGQIPLKHREHFYNAAAQVQMTSLRFPKIGTIVRGKDGSYDIGPLPNIGGPFETATAFFEAWAAHAKFPISEESICRIEGEFVQEVLASIRDFPHLVKSAASRLASSSSDRGPFPLCHRDFFHSNVVIDQQYNILGVIDWDDACTLPWELVEFPLFLEAVPVPMDVPWNYDENGQAHHSDTRLRWQERRKYVDMVARFESREGTDDKLSAALRDDNIQNLATAMRLYLNPGKLGFYGQVVAQYRIDGSNRRRVSPEGLAQREEEYHAESIQRSETAANEHG